MALLVTRGAEPKTKKKVDYPYLGETTNGDIVIVNSLTQWVFLYPTCDSTFLFGEVWESSVELPKTTPIEGIITLKNKFE